MPTGVYPHKPLSEETKRKIGIASSNPSEATRKKISVALSGKKKPPFSAETRKKMSEAKELNPTRYWSGKQRSEETKIKIRNKRKLQVNPKGEKHWNWKNGITPVNRQIRQSFQMNEWRTMVFGRDGFACQMCFRKGVYLEAHHIRPFAKYPELRFDLDNGITLCKECHNKTKKKEEEFAPLLETLVLNQNRGSFK